MSLRASNLPTTRPSLTLDFAKSRRLDPRITFARNSIGTVTNSSGQIVTVPANVARFDHNPTTGESLGLLVEEPRTNLAIYSENPTQWTASACSLGSPTRLNRYGDGNVSSFLANGTASAHRIIRAVSGSVTANALYSFSFLVAKSSNSDTRLITARLRTAVGGQAVSINVSDDGAASSYSFRSSFPFGASPPAAITSNEMFVSVASDGWTRITLVTAASNANTTLSQWDIGFSPSAAGIELIAGTANTLLFVDQVQIEAGAFPTSYIPTTTAAATRSADVVNITGSNFSSWYNQTEGTVFTEYRDPGVSGTNRTPFAISDGTGSNRIQFFVSGITTVNNRHVSSSGGTNNPGNLSAALNSRNRHAIACAVGSCNAASNGTLATASTPATMPVVNRLNIGINGEGTGDLLNAPIARLCYWPQALPSQLQALTQ